MSSCQHDALLPNCSMEIQLNWQGSRIVCTECLRAAFVTKRGRITDADPPEHTITAQETPAARICPKCDRPIPDHWQFEICNACPQG